METIRGPEEKKEWTADVTCQGCKAVLRIVPPDVSRRNKTVQGWYPGESWNQTLYVVDCPHCKAEIQVPDFPEHLYRG